MVHNKRKEAEQRFHLFIEQRNRRYQANISSGIGTLDNTDDFML